MSNTIEIREVCDVFDGPHATPKKTATGPIYLGIDAITADCRLNPLEYNYLSEEDYKIWTKRVTPVENDIVFSYEATLGRYAMIPANFYGCLGRRLALIRVKDNRINPTWLYYYFMSPEWKVFIANHTVKGSTVDRISVEAFPSYKIPSIERKKQDDIVKILKSIDDRIENNKRICSELEAMAKSLYDYWFVQFDFPDENGRPYRTSGGAMEWNDQLKQEIPNGWKVMRICDIADLYQPKTLSGSDMVENGLYNVYGANGIIGKYNSYNHENRTIAITCRGASCGNFLMTLPKSWITGNAMVVSPHAEISQEYLYYTLSKDRISPFITGSAQPQITRENLSNLLVVIADEKNMTAFSTFSDVVRSKIESSVSENEELTKLRDWLLPMLMNGQAKVE